MTMASCASRRRKPSPAPLPPRSTRCPLSSASPLRARRRPIRHTARGRVRRRVRRYGRRLWQRVAATAPPHALRHTRRACWPAADRMPTGWHSTSFDAAFVELRRAAAACLSGLALALGASPHDWHKLADLSDAADTALCRHRPTVRRRRARARRAVGAAAVPLPLGRDRHRLPRTL